MKNKKEIINVELLVQERERELQNLNAKLNTLKHEIERKELVYNILKNSLITDNDRSYGDEK